MAESIFQLKTMSNYLRVNPDEIILYQNLHLSEKKQFLKQVKSMAEVGGDACSECSDEYTKGDDIKNLCRLCDELSKIIPVPLIEAEIEGLGVN